MNIMLKTNSPEDAIHQIAEWAARISEKERLASVGEKGIRKAGDMRIRANAFAEVASFCRSIKIEAP